jgi:hypothetical protein
MRVRLPSLALLSIHIVQTENARACLPARIRWGKAHRLPVPQMSDTHPIDLNSAFLGIRRHLSGVADPFNGHIDEFRISHVQRCE